jgi:nucleotide-binding universal stress UspA family protein
VVSETLSIDTVMVGTEGRPEDERALEALCRTFNPGRVRLILVHVLTVPPTVPLDVSMPKTDAEAEQVLQRARHTAAARGFEVSAAVLRGRSVGERLVEEAERSHVDAICVRFRSRPVPGGHHIASATVATLLDRAPCPVIILHMPHRRR